MSLGRCARFCGFASLGLMIRVLILWFRLRLFLTFWMALVESFIWDFGLGIS